METSDIPALCALGNSLLETFLAVVNKTCKDKEFFNHGNQSLWA